MVNFNGSIAKEKKRKGFRGGLRNKDLKDMCFLVMFKKFPCGYQNSGWIEKEKKNDL
jgi:hypothetical protein